MNDVDLARAKKVMVDILIEVARICKKHEIKYWLDFGTLLGAVRHKGFIPWDDDIDITMPRKDYNKFIEIASTELKDCYFLQTKYTDKKYFWNWIKVRDKNSIFLEHGSLENVDKEKNGIFIDIFPLDRINKKHIWVFNLLRKLFQINPYKAEFPSLTKKYLHIILSPFYLFRRFYLYSSISLLRNNQGDTAIYGIEAWFSHSIDYDLLYPLREIEFENHKFNVINGYMIHLEQYYGDFMQLPPIEQRTSHAKIIQFLD